MTSSSIRDPKAPVPVVSLAMLRQSCREVGLSTFAAFLTAAPGVQFATKLERARVRWETNSGIERQGMRLLDDAALNPGKVEEFTGYTAVEVATAIEALRNGSARLSYVHEIWAPRDSPPSPDEDLQPAPRPTVPSRPPFRRPVRVRDDLEGDARPEADRPETELQPDAVPFVPSATWRVDPHTILVPRSFAVQCVQELLRAPVETLAAWDADAKDAALLKDLLDPVPDAPDAAPRLAYAFKT